MKPITSRTSRGGRGRGAVAAVLAALLLVAGCSGAERSAEGSAGLSGDLPDTFPQDFPLPPGAVVAGTGDALTLHVDATAEDVGAFYDDELPASGWTVVSDWSGVDPAGNPASGYTVERGEEVGVLSISDSEDSSVLRINFSQPRNDPNRGMNAPGPRTPPEDEG
jgi:hypothetical protein